MKKVLSILMIALLALTMVSCNRGNETEDLIIGKWEQTEDNGKKSAENERKGKER